MRGAGWNDRLHRKRRLLLRRAEGRARAGIDAGLAFAEGFLVETWTRQKEPVSTTRSSAVKERDPGTSSCARTATSYFVYIEDPGKEAAADARQRSGPCLAGRYGTVAERLALAGTHKTTLITGNNVRAYLDAVSNNRPDQGGTA